MLLELILLSELLKTPSGKFTSFFGRDTEKETLIVLPVEPKVVVKDFGSQLTDYPEGWDAKNVVVNLDPAQIEIYKESERVKKALRGL